MKSQSNLQPVESKKVIAIMALFATSTLIMAFGVIFSIISVINNISFMIMNSSIHGAVFGLVISFLGLRYFISVFKLKTEVYKTTSRFSWSNFKKDKHQKALSKIKH